MGRRFVPIFIVFFCSLGLFHRAALAGPCQFKAAVLFPEGTTWMKNIRKIVEEVKEKTDGACTFVIYTGGTQGDEPVVLGKMRLGQINMGFFSGMGLHKVDRAIEILEMPGLYDTSQGLDRAYKEADFLHEKMLPVFQERFRKKGYELIALASQGFMYLYTTKRVQTYDEMRGLKWMLWSGLLLNQKMCEGFQANCIPIAFPEILTALQTGLLDAVFINPLTLVSLQWHTEVKYVIDMPVTHGIGGLLITRKTWDKISPVHQQIIRDAFNKYLPQIHASNRRDDKTIADSLPEQGIETIAPSKELLEKYNSVAQKMRQEMVGDLYPQEILDQVLAYLKEYRSKNPPPPSGMEGIEGKDQRRVSLLSSRVGRNR